MKLIILFLYFLNIYWTLSFLQISFGFAYLFFPSKISILKMGLFTLGCSPGGGASNIWTYLLGGNLNLSITMTFISTVAALGKSFNWPSFQLLLITNVYYYLYIVEPYSFSHKLDGSDVVSYSPVPTELQNLPWSSRVGRWGLAGGSRSLGR